MIVLFSVLIYSKKRFDPSLCIFDYLFFSFVPFIGVPIE